MWIERLDASHALAYRELMLEAYDRHPQAFTSSVRERAVMPLSWWEARLTSKLDVVLGAFEAGTLAGIVGLAFEPREKARHKSTLFGLYVSADFRQHGLFPAGPVRRRLQLLTALLHGGAFLGGEGLGLLFGLGRARRRCLRRFRRIFLWAHRNLHA